ncbi:hypothetical protein ABIE49_000935 [Bradyrhizobium sp. OAE829]
MPGSAIRPCPLPADALLARYAGAGAYTDCYALDVAGAVSHAAYVEAFYTGRMFKIERFLLGLLLSKPSTDIEVKQLAIGKIDHFSGWRVEDRSANQVLLRDLISGKTRSWLMVAPQAEGTTRATRLFFGSAVLADRSKQRGSDAWAQCSRRYSGFTSSTREFCWTVRVHASRRSATMIAPRPWASC